jgi:hypothetical protein
MAGLFDNLADFIEGLFTSDPQALRAKRQLREQAEVLQEVRPAVFSSRSDQVLVGFAQSWGTVHALMAPLRDLFDKTLSHPDRKVQELSLGFLVESVLTGEIADRRLALTYETMKDRLARSGDPNQENAMLTSEFNSLFSELRRQDTEKTQKDFEGLFRLKALSGHSLVPLLNRFGYDAAVAAQHYRAVDGASVLTELLDLYFVVEGLDLGTGVEQLLGLLLEKVGPQKAPENRRKTAAILEKMRNLSRGPCSPHLLLQLIRVLQRNPDAQPEIQRFPDRYIQVYSGSLSERFIRDRDRALREQSESSLEADIAALFSGTPLLSLEFYNAEASKQLTDAGLPPLAAVKALQILRSFGFSVLRTGYLDSVKKVVLEGFFTDKDWGQKFSDALYGAEEMLTRLEAFDHALDSDSKTGFAALEKYLSGKVPVSSVPRQIVDKINRQAMALLEEEARVLSVLAQRIQEVLNDYKSPHPEWVGNIKSLGGKDQRTLLESLIGGYNKTAQLLRILKHFIVVK